MSGPKSAQDQPMAVALHYDGEQAPSVTASGTGDVAKAIIAMAKAHGIPIKEDPDLMALLAQLELNEEIPESLYRVVAEVIAFAYFLTGKKPPGY